MGIKESLVGSWLGSFADESRSMWQLLRTASRNMEKLGTCANDYIAGKLIVSLCPAHGCFLDVGAHIGSVIAGVLRSTPTATVIAVEATPSKATSLRRKFPGVTIHDCAVGAQKGTAQLYINAARPGYNSLNSRSSSTATIEVDVNTLDDIVGQHVDVMKLDIEGGELDALRGAFGLLSNSKPLIMFESGPNSDDYRASMYGLLSEHGYSIFTPNRVAHSGCGMSLQGFQEAHIYPRLSTNYFAIHGEHRIRVRDAARAILALGEDMH